MNQYIPNFIFVKPPPPVLLKPERVYVLVVEITKTVKRVAK